MEFHQFHGYGRFSRKKANFTENVTAVKSRIRLVHSNIVIMSLLPVSLQKMCHVIG